jgi:uncharacterized membrane protein
MKQKAGILIGWIILLCFTACVVASTISYIRWIL